VGIFHPEIEMAVVRWLAALGGRSWLLDGVALQVATSPVFRALPAVAVLSGYWVAQAKRAQSGRVRRTVVAAFLVSFAAGGTSRVIQNLWATQRPIHSSALRSLFSPAFLASIGEDFHSFPSDHAAFLLPLVWYVGRLRTWLGALMGVLMCANLLSRLYTGIHFPVDVAAGLVLGALVILVAERLWPGLADRVATLVATAEHRRPTTTAVFLFVLTYGFATMFDDFRSLGRALLRALARL
jgi:undecaprenyl-diphosphatase